MEELIKQLNRAGKKLAVTIDQAREHAEDKILTLMSEELYQRGYEVNKLDEYFDFSRQSLEINEGEGLLIHEAFIVGEKETKKVLKAYRLEISYKPEGFDSEKGLVMKVRGRVEDVTESFFYPEDDDSLFI